MGAVGCFDAQSLNHDCSSSCYKYIDIRRVRLNICKVYSSLDSPHLLSQAYAKGPLFVHIGSSRIAGVVAFAQKNGLPASAFDRGN
jgi:hypothetical protein